MKFVSMLAVIAALAGCDVLRKVGPQTVAGFEANGILGALDGASGAILARCRMLDGSIVRIAVDDLAILAGQGDLVTRVGAARARACAVAGGVQAIAAVTN